jgi:hypothetical protein
MGVWKQGRKGWGIPFPLIIVCKIVHYTLIAGAWVLAVSPEQISPRYRPQSPEALR